MKRKLALLLTAGFLLTSLVGCADTGSPSGSKPKETASKSETGGAEESKAPGSGEVVEITFWHYMNEDKEGIIVKEAIDEFNASQNEIHVTGQFIPRQELMKQYTIGVVSGDLPDIGMVDNPDHASFASMGVFEDITDLFNEWEDAHFLEGSLNSTVYKDRIYGIPWGNNALGLFYDADLLEEAGIEVPTTWSELERAAELLTTEGRYGLAISAPGSEEGTFQYMPWLLSAGGNVNEIDSEAGKESLNFLKNLIDKGYMSREVINWTQGDIQKQFAAGQAAMMINGPWQFAAMENDAPDKNWSVAKVPRADDGEYASVLGGENVGICKGANVEVAWTFLTWLTSSENSQRICKGIGRFSPRSDVDLQEMFAGDEMNLLFAEILPTAQSRGPSPVWPEISAAIYTAVQEVFTGQKDIDVSLADAQAKIEEINASN